MSLLVITGMSGSGKSRAIDSLEDIGFYCVDNLPPSFLVTFARFSQDRASINNLAVVIDSRSKDMFINFEGELEKLRINKIDYKLMFIDCDDQILLNRYKETRRKHPLMDGNNISLDEAIKKERLILKNIKESADYLFDTTHLSAAQLKQEIIDVCASDTFKRLQIKFISFGYKYGLPIDADVIFDVRCLPNPFYVEALKNKTGNDPEVYDFVFGFPQALILRNKLLDLMSFTVPLFIEEGKSQLVVAIGCTGGKHRSVSFVNYIAENLLIPEINTVIVHRDIEK